MFQVRKVNYTKYLLTILSLALLMLQQTQASITILNSDGYTDYIFVETSKANEDTEDLNIKFFIGNYNDDPIALGRHSGYSLKKFIKLEDQLRLSSYLEYATIAGGVVASILIGRKVGQLKLFKDLSKKG